MSRRSFRFEERYDAAAERVYALLVDPAVQRDKALFLGAREARCEQVDAKGGDGTLRLVELRSVPLWPRGVESVIVLEPRPADLRVCWRQRFADARLPVTVSGEIAVIGDSYERSDLPPACRLVFSGEVDVPVGLVGGAIARAVVRGIGAAKRREHGFYLARLAGTAPTRQKS